MGEEKTPPPVEKGAESPKPPEGKAAPAEKAEAPKEAKAPASNLPPGILARVNGREVTIQDYVAYLFASVGKSKLREFIDRILIEEEAKALEVAPPTPEEVEGKVNAQIESSVRALYQNNMDRFVESLSQRGLTLDEHKARLRQDTAYRLLEERCILKKRKVTEEDIKGAFEKTYGEGGIQYELRHILISTRPRPQVSAEKRTALTDQEAREKAEKVSKELQGGADFVQLVKTYSDDELTKRNEGRIIHYQKGYRGKDFDEAVKVLTEDKPLSGVVRTPQGYEIIQLVSRKATRFEDKREELLKSLETRAPTPQERNVLLKGLREKAKIEQ